MGELSVLVLDPPPSALCHSAIRPLPSALPAQRSMLRAPLPLLLRFGSFTGREGRGYTVLVGGDQDLLKDRRGEVAT